MGRLLTLTALLHLACAGVSPGPSGAEPAPVQVFCRSHNRSVVDVYLQCGERQTRWLGTVSAKGAAGFEIPPHHARCLLGLRFVLVVRSSRWIYPVGPIRPQAGDQVTLLIEKYAGLSAARVQ